MPQEDVPELGSCSPTSPLGDSLSLNMELVFLLEWLAGWLSSPAIPSYLCQVPLTQERSYGQMWPHPAFYVGAGIQTQILLVLCASGSVNNQAISLAPSFDFITLKENVKK